MSQLIKRLGPVFAIDSETTVEQGFAILDARNRVWLDMFFHDEDGANATAARCLGDGHRIVPVRRVCYIDRPHGPRTHGFKRIKILVDE